MDCQKMRPFISEFVTNLFHFCVPRNQGLLENQKYQVFKLVLIAFFWIRDNYKRTNYF